VYQYLFGGKEFQDELGIDAYDFEARFYSPDGPRFWQIDPMAEKYYSISPYAYCANNPIRLNDPTGMDMTDYGMTSGGYIEQIGPKNDEPDRLYLIDDSKKKISENHVTVKDKTILPELKKVDSKKNDVSKVTRGSSSAGDLANIFKFAADNTTVEWGFAKSNDKNGNTVFTTGTVHDAYYSPSQDEQGLNNNTMLDWTHSHNGIDPAEEKSSMGFIRKGFGYGDYKNYLESLVTKTPSSNKNYFPISKNLYNMGSSGPYIIRTLTKGNDGSDFLKP